MNRRKFLINSAITCSMILTFPVMTLAQKPGIKVEKTNYLIELDGWIMGSQDKKVLNGILERDKVISERDKAMSEHNELLNSNSWKITEPLRGLSRLFK